VRRRTPARVVLAAVRVLPRECPCSWARGAAGQAARTPVRHVDSSAVWVSRSPKAEARAASSPLAPWPGHASSRPASPSQKDGTAARADGPAAAGQASGRPVRPSSLPATSPCGVIWPLLRPLAAGGPCGEQSGERLGPALRRHRNGSVARTSLLRGPTALRCDKRLPRRERRSSRYLHTGWKPVPPVQAGQRGPRALPPLGAALEWLCPVHGEHEGVAECVGRQASPSSSFWS